MTGANFSVTGEGGVPHHHHRHHRRRHSKLHHPNSIILLVPVVDTASCDWRHALHRLIGILNWKTAGGKRKYRHPEDCHTKTTDKCVSCNPSQRREMLTMLKWSKMLRSDSTRMFPTQQVLQRATNSTISVMTKMS